MPIWDEFPGKNNSELHLSMSGLLHHCSRHQPLLRHARLQCARALSWHWATTLLPALPRWPRLSVPSNCPNRWPEQGARNDSGCECNICLRWNMMGKSASVQNGNRLYSSKTSLKRPYYNISSEAGNSTGSTGILMECALRPINS